jgi:3D (Asp-Asp-Asp) domain-containing protein
MKFLTILILLTMQNEVTVTATIYHAVEGQTDSTPNLTATMFEIDLNNPRKHNIIAVSRDLECLGFKMGKKVLVSGAGDLSGVWVIEDRMNKRFCKRIDFLVNTTRKGGKWKNVKISLIN